MLKAEGQFPVATTQPRKSLFSIGCQKVEKSTSFLDSTTKQGNMLCKHHTITMESYVGREIDILAHIL